MATINSHLFMAYKLLLALADEAEAAERASASEYHQTGNIQEDETMPVVMATTSLSSSEVTRKKPPTRPCPPSSATGSAHLSRSFRDQD